MGELNLPPLTQQPIMHVDGSPDAGYPLRILRAYRANCDSRYEGSGDEGARIFCETMNDHQRQRAEILDKAIATLEAPHA